MNRNKETRGLLGRMSIKSRLMLYLALFVAFIIGLLWLCQIVFLDDFYRYFKTETIKTSGDIIAQNIESTGLSSLCEQIASENELCVRILDEDYNDVASAEGTFFCLIHHLDLGTLHYYCDQITDDTPLVQTFHTQQQKNNRFEKDNFAGFMIPEDASRRNQSLLYTRKLTLADGSLRYLLVNAQITPVDATVSTLRSQLLLITTVVLLAAMLLAVWLSRRFSRPIIDANAAARALAKGHYDPPASAHSYREIAELNDTLVHAAQELSQVEHLQHELIANISHDLRTPLTMIGGYAEVMRDIPDERSPENLQIVIDETKRLSSLVSELLDISKLDAGAIRMEPVAFDLTETVREILTRFAKLREQDGYNIVFAPEAELRAVADPSRIAQVIYNLVGNALTYTGEDKTVTVTQEARGSQVRVSIRDTGKGIPADELPLIWNRYYRAKENHKRAIQGSGLGLSICRGILDSHGVPYGVESTVGEGTTFWFELPMAEEENKA